jgi:hypothetical protein
MTDLRRFRQLQKRIEPLAVILREDHGIHEFKAAMLAAALLHSQAEDRFAGIRDLVGEVPAFVERLLAVRLGRCTEREFAELCEVTAAAEKLREMTAGTAQVRAFYSVRNQHAR